MSFKARAGRQKVIKPHTGNDKFYQQRKQRIEEHGPSASALPAKGGKAIPQEDDFST